MTEDDPAFPTTDRYQALVLGDFQFHSTLASQYREGRYYRVISSLQPSGQVHGHTKGHFCQVKSQTPIEHTMTKSVAIVPQAIRTRPVTALRVEPRSPSYAFSVKVAREPSAKVFWIRGHARVAGSIFQGVGEEQLFGPCTLYCQQLPTDAELVGRDIELKRNSLFQEFCKRRDRPPLSGPV